MVSAESWKNSCSSDRNCRSYKASSMPGGMRSRKMRMALIGNIDRVEYEMTAKHAKESRIADRD